MIKLYYVILRSVPGYRSCFLNFGAGGDAVVGVTPAVFNTEFEAADAAAKFEQRLGGKAVVRSTMFIRP